MALVREMKYKYSYYDVYFYATQKKLNDTQYSH